MAGSRAVLPFRARTWNTRQTQGNHGIVGFAGIVPSVAITMLGHDSMTKLQLFLRKHLRFVSGPRFAVTLLWTDGHLVRAATCGRPAQTHSSLG